MRKSRYLRGQAPVLVWLPGLERRALSPFGYMGDGDRQKGEGNKVQEGYINQMQVMVPWIEPWHIVELLNEESGRGARQIRSDPNRPELQRMRVDRKVVFDNLFGYSRMV